MTTAPPPLRTRLARIAPFFRGTRWGFVLAIAGSAIAAMTEPLVPELLKQLLDGGFQERSFPLWMVPVAIIGVFGVRGIAGFIAQYGLAWSSNHAVLSMRQAMFQRLLDTEPALFNRTAATSLVNTLAYEVQSGTAQLVHSSQTLLKDSLTLMAVLAYLLWTNWQLTLFVAVLFPAVALVMRVLTKRLHRLTLETQRATDEIAYVVEENVLAWRIVRLHDAGPTQLSRFRRLSEALRRLSIKSVIANSAMTPTTQLLSACALSAVIVAALWQSAAGGTGVGDFVAFVTAMLLLINPIKHLSEVAGPITRGLAAVERAVNLLESTQPEVSGGYDPGRSTGHVELRDVSLRYRDEQAPALDHVSLELRPGEAVALVGPSGAGKSTLVNLLPRFIEPTEGTLLLDGRPLAEWDVKALRRQFALVSQDVVLFNDSVAANVALGEAIDEPRIRDALKGANLLDFAEGLPNGIHTVIGHNGAELSGGQRQRLAIARAIHKNAPILILDEATSALDSESERLVQQALETLMHGRTSLVIAHRLSPVERPDRIVGHEGGRVVEQGTHAELLTAGGLYARLHALQFRS